MVQGALEGLRSRFRDALPLLRVASGILYVTLGSAWPPGTATCESVREFSGSQLLRG
jgi:hypothetical protein